MPKRPLFMTTFNSQHVKGLNSNTCETQTLLKSESSTFILFFINLRVIELEKVFFSHSSNLKTIC